MRTPRRHDATVSVDTERCQGHGVCAMWAPDIFELDDLGYACVATATVAGPLLDAARRGAAGCPERAITIVEEA